MKKKLTSIILCMVMTASLIQSVNAEDDILVNESFNDYATNMIPDDLDINAKAYNIEEYEKNDKGLKLYAGTSSSIYDLAFSSQSEFCVYFEMSASKNIPTGSLCAINAAGTAQELLRFTEQNIVTAYNGFPVGNFGSEKHSYAIFVDLKQKLCDIYVDGILYVDNFRISKAQITSAVDIRFIFSSKDGEGWVLLDNINVTTGKKPMKSYPVKPFNDEKEEIKDFTFGRNVGSNTVADINFETGAGIMSLYNGGGSAKIVDDDANKALLMERNSTTDFHQSINGISSDSDVLVYDFKFKVLDDNSIFNVVQKDSKEHFQTLGELGQGAKWYFPVGQSIALSTDKWYRVSVIEDYYNRTIEYYFDKKLIGTSSILDTFAVNGATASILRFHETIYQTYAPTRAQDTDSIKFMLDDVRIYEGDEIKDELTKSERKIDVNTRKSVYKSDSSEAKSVENRQAIHARSGIVINNGIKSLMDNKPFIKDGKYYIPVRESLDKLLVEYRENTPGILTLSDGYEYKIGTDKSVIKNDRLYVPVESLLEKVKKPFVKLDCEYNAGAYVLDPSFKAPSEQSDIQRLNDYMFYLRPDSKTIEDTYKNSKNYGQHPRIQATKEDFERIKEEIKTDEYKSRWAKSVIAQADQLLNTAPVEYKIEGDRLLEVSRKVLNRMYALGMAYQLTGENKYSERAYLEMKTVSDFSDWHPSHHLDPCEMAAAVAIGYDWMYDAFSDEQKKVIEKGMYNNCFYDAWLAFQSESSAMTNAATATNNHNIVCNGGILMGALAMADVYPEEAYYLASNAVRGMDMMMYHFAPNGAWYEGAHYWEYTMQYTAKALSTMETALGSDLGMGQCEGLSESADSELYLQSPLGIYNYADSLLASVYTPEMFWLSNKYKTPDVTKAVLYFTDGKMGNAEDMALALLWYDTKIGKGKTDMTLDKYYDDLGTIVMRNSWLDAEPVFVGIHAGETNVDHAQLDGGSFIFENQGIRWAKELGMGNYNSEGYWDQSAFGTRWTHFRSRAESHNTIVINPNDKPDHNVLSNAKMNLVESKPRGSIVTVDMSELLSENATSAKRGFAFTDDRKSLIIRDEINLKKQSDVYWFMITDADAKIDENGATFIYNGRKLRLDYVTNAKAQLSIEKAKPLPTSPKTREGDDPVEQSNRFMIKLSGSGNVNITVKLSDIDDDGTNVKEYDKNISEWKIPDGEIPKAPSIDTIKVGSREFKTSGLKSVQYNYVEGTLDTPPTVSCDENTYDITIENAKSLNEAAKITVTDKNNRKNKTVYYVYFNKILKPIEFDNRISIPVMSYSVSDEPQAENAAKNLFDNNKSTRWSAEGSGNWILLDLGSVQKLDDVAIAFMKSGDRKYYLNISVSEDNEVYEKTFDGESYATDDYEFFTLGGKSARFVKIECNGNSQASGENWNSYTEVVVIRKK